MPLYLEGGPVVRQNQALEDFDTPFRTYLRSKFNDALDNNLTPLLGEQERLRQTYAPGMLDPGDPMAGIDPTFGPMPVRVDAATARARVQEARVKLDIPDDGIPDAALNILIERRRRQRAYDDAISRSPTGVRSVAGVAASFVGAALDPLNIASAFVPVVGEARYTLMLGRAAGAMGRAGVRAGVGAMEGLAGMAMLEPFTYSAHQSLQDDYKALDSLINIGFGGVLGGGLHVAGGAVRDVLQPGRWKSPEARRADVDATNRAIAAHYADETAIIAGQSAERAGAVDRILAASDQAATEAHAARGAMRTAQGLPPEPVGMTAARIVNALEENRARLTELQEKPGFLLTADEKVLLDAGEQGVEALTPELRAVAETPEVQRAVEIIQKPGFLRTAEENAFLAGLRKDVTPAALRRGEVTAPSVATATTAPTPARPTPALRLVYSADAHQRETALRTAVAQSVDGRTVDVDPIFKTEADLAAAIKRQGAPESSRLADFEASRMADERLAAAPKSNDLKDAEAALAETLSDLESRWQATGRSSRELERVMPELRAMMKQADELSNAARAAALCDIGGA